MTLRSEPGKILRYLSIRYTYMLVQTYPVILRAIEVRDSDIH
jgi:hypothetical protein